MYLVDLVLALITSTLASFVWIFVISIEALVTNYVVVYTVVYLSPSHPSFFLSQSRTCWLDKDRGLRAPLITGWWEQCAPTREIWVRVLLSQNGVCWHLICP